MPLGHHFLKELRSIQYLASLYVILALMDAAINTALHWNEVDTLASIVLLAVLGYHLFFLILAWQLGKLHEWMRKTLLVLAYLGLFGLAGAIMRLAHEGPIQGNMLYKIYYYGIRIIVALVDASLVSYLTRPSVRDAFQVKHARTSVSDIPQDAQ
jgi:hypothetical protein